MQRMLILLAGALVTAGRLWAAQPFSLDQLAPALSQLGPGWTSNHVVVMVDGRSPTNEVCNEGKGWLQAAHNVVGKRGCEVYAVLRYFSGSNSVLVRIHRYRSRKDIGDDWGKDKDTKDAPGNLPKVGEEVRFYQRDGMHNDIAFRRGNYLITVEGAGAPLEKLKQLAEALDGNLVKAQSSAVRSEAAATQFVAEGGELRVMAR
jgi:hypothetical protein